MSLASAYQQLVAMNIFVVQESSKLFLMVLKAVGSWAALSRYLTGQVFVLLCPTQGCRCHCGFGNALLLSTKQIRMFTKKSMM